MKTNRALLSKIIITIVILSVFIVIILLSNSLFLRSLLGGITYNSGENNNNVVTKLVYRNGGYLLIITGSGNMSESIPDDWKDNLIHISYGWKVPIKSVIIEDGITYVSSSAFIGCSKLETVTLPKSLKQIGYSAFSYCNNLKTIEFAGTTIEWEQISDNSINWDYESSVENIKCIDGTIEL